MTKLVITEQPAEGVVLVRLNRPEKMNALNMEMFRELTRLAKRLKKDRHLRAVIISGSGADFCSGLDIRSVLAQPAQIWSLLFKWLPWQANRVQKASRLWRQLPCPVIAAVEGRCLGGGLQIALGADIRLASPSAQFSIMESRYGLIPDMAGNLALRQLLPADQAMLLAMSADIISAKDALRLGLVTRICNSPEADAIALAEKLSERSPDALAAIKKLFLNHWHSSDRTILMKETWYQIRILLGRNQRTAVAREQGKDKDFGPRQNW